MIDVTSLLDSDEPVDALEPHVNRTDLARLTNEMIDGILNRLAGATDEMVTFVPEDPEAHDPYARDKANETLPWTLGHVIMHTTASAEESAFLAAEMARGVRPRGRSRYEVPWEQVTTIAHCYARLEESRRMRLASLMMWPDEPHLENTVEIGRRKVSIGPVGRFLSGLLHDRDHLDQISKIVAQASGG